MEGGVPHTGDAGALLWRSVCRWDGSTSHDGRTSSIQQALLKGDAWPPVLHLACLLGPATPVRTVWRTISWHTTEGLHPIK